MSSSTKRKCASNMSKLRFYQIIERAFTYIHDVTDQQAFLTDIKNIMHFDPMLTQFAQINNDNDKRGVSVMSKKRFFEINEQSKKYIDSQHEQDALRNDIMRIMKFDPDAKQYNPEKAAQRRTRDREEAQADGVSVYAMKAIKCVKRLDKMLTLKAIP